MTIAWEDRRRQRTQHRIKLTRADLDGVNEALDQLTTRSSDRVVLVFAGADWAPLRDSLAALSRARKINWYTPATSELRALGYEATLKGYLVATDRAFGNALLVFGRAS